MPIPARRPVPRLDGQVKMYPSRLDHMNPWPFSSMCFSTSFNPRQNRSKTFFMSPPKRYYNLQGLIQKLYRNKLRFIISGRLTTKQKYLMLFSRIQSSILDFLKIWGNFYLLLVYLRVRSWFKRGMSFYNFFSSICELYISLIGWPHWIMNGHQ